MKATFAALWLLAALTLTPAAAAERVGDLAQIAGVRSNQIVGYGLVVGLDGTGDQTSQAPFTTQSLQNMLQQFGVTVPPNVRPQLRNVAAVSITAELPAFAKPGQTIDITVASIGNAKSLRGGSLLMTPLRGADGEIYALAQGNVVVGGVGASGASGSSVQVNVLNTGRIPAGGMVERGMANAFAVSDGLVFNLHSPNFSTASRIVTAINAAMGEGVAQALDGASIAVRAPVSPDQRVSFVGMINDISVEPGNLPARVIINARTGTVVIGANVTVSAAAVAHGGIEVSISEQPFASQPGPLADGSTVVVPDSSVSITERGGTAFKFGPGVSLDEIISAINRVGAAPSDLISILQALKESGALRAELVVI